MRDIIRFTRHEDKTITVDGFPEEIAVTPELLGSGESTMRTFVEITAANGRAVYEIVDCESTYPSPEGGCRLIAKRVMEHR